MLCWYFEVSFYFIFHGNTKAFWLEVRKPTQRKACGSHGLYYIKIFAVIYSFELHRSLSVVARNRNRLTITRLEPTDRSPPFLLSNLFIVHHMTGSPTRKVVPANLELYGF